MKMFSLLSAAIAGLLLFASGPALGASCVTNECHAALPAVKFPHAPVKEGECGSCHTPLAKEHPAKGGSFALAAKGEKLCKECHDLGGNKKMQHAPVKEGDCTSCHKPHGSNARYLLEVGDDRTPLCVNCHDGAPFKAAYMHGPAAVGACNSCHDPHQSDEKKLMKGPVRNLCLQCHADFAASMKEASFVHPPVAKDPCTACHDPHGSGVSMFLKKKSPDLCVNCHRKIGAQVGKVKVPHKPVVAPGGCSNCHSAHFSKGPKLLPSTELELCLNCHGKDNVGTPALKNIKTQLEGKKFLHGPIQKGECKGCHDPHGSDNFRLLRGKYPAELYATYQDGVYEACLKCHEKNLLRFAETTIYTKFRNGNRNLHVVHVGTRKGRTCRICHQPHASDGEKLISKDGAMFGDWKIPINFVSSSTGGSCAPGCHQKFNYDRQKPVVYRPE